MPTSEQKPFAFLGLVLAFVFLVFLLFAYQERITSFLDANLSWLALLVFLLILVWRFDFILFLKDYERSVIMRFGKVHRVGGPGWTLMAPILESSHLVDLRTKTIDVPKQDVISQDGIELKIDAIIYMKVKSDAQSVINSVVKVEDYKEASRLFVVSLIRDVAGTMPLSELVSNVGDLNLKLQEGLKELAEDWGVKILSVEIKDIDIPQTVLEAMHEEKAAVQRKLARMEEAKATKAEIDSVKEAAEHLSDKALSYYYIKALEKLGEGKSTKLIFPMEISKLAEAISGKMSPSTDSDELLKKYGPLLAKILKEEKERREGAET